MAALDALGIAARLHLETPMTRWMQAAITIGVLLATVATAWGVMSTRVSAAETKLERVARDTERIDRRQTASDWMLYRICERVEAQPCYQPGER